MQPEPLQPLTRAEAEAVYALCGFLVANMRTMRLQPCQIISMMTAYVTTLQALFPADGDVRDSIDAVLEQSVRIGTEQTLHALLAATLMSHIQGGITAKPTPRASHNPKDYDLGALNQLMPPKEGPDDHA